LHNTNSTFTVKLVPVFLLIVRLLSYKKSTLLGPHTKGSLKCTPLKEEGCALLLYINGSVLFSIIFKCSCMA